MQKENPLEIYVSSGKAETLRTEAGVFFVFFWQFAKRKKPDFMRVLTVSPIFQKALKNQDFGFFGDFSGMKPL